MKFNAIIFDFDGVIIDSERLKFNDLKTLLKKRGLKLPNSRFKEMIGKKTKYFLINEFEGKLTNKQIEYIITERNRLAHNYALIKGVKSFIRFLKNRKIKLGLATGTKRAIVSKVIKDYGINDFSFKVTGEEFKRSKPNPEVYKKAIQKSKTDINKIAVIEDSVAGVKSAKKAGLYCIAITTNQTKNELKEADLIVNSFGKLRNELDTL